MTYLVLLVSVLFLLPVVGALVYAYRKLSHGRFLVLVAALLLVPPAWWKLHERRVVLQVVPDALEVRTVAYRSEESWGFGPGGNEVGIRFFPLSEAVSREVAKRGLGYFEQLPPDADRQGRGWRGQYEQWSETPVRGDHWKIDPGTGLMDVTDYLCAHGFCIDVRPERLKQANEIVSRPGSFYARGRIGIIVVSPERRTVLYFYNG